MHDAQTIIGNHSNKQVDLAHLFERRRHIIDAAIVRILKRDREVSMDTIASVVSNHCNFVSCKNLVRNKCKISN